ncbi:A-kinase anchor protein 7-like isoform X2 [Triplophysa rosa]|nr:A-kinase anchor protein 7-like isoform X2 [Triplophysa rosa]
MQCVTETRSVACGEDVTSCTLQHQTRHINTTEAVKKVIRKSKKEPKKSKKKRKERRAAGCSDSLMSELPFSNTEIWTELGFTSSQASVKKKRKRGESGRVESEEDGDKKKKKQTTRPNYFVSVPITNPKIKEAVEEVQKLVLEKDGRLSRALVPVDTLHITLLVTHLRTQQQLEVAVSALCDLQDSLNTLLEGRSLVLPFCGVGHFKQEVAFVQIAEGDHLSTLTHMAERVRKAFEERGITSADDKAFKPHLTFLKLSRAPKLRKQGVKKLCPTLLSDFESRVFGDECVCRVDLCSMLKKKSADGYYHCEKSVTFICITSWLRPSEAAFQGWKASRHVRIQCLLYHPSPEIPPSGRCLKGAQMYPSLPSMSHNSVRVLTGGGCVIGRARPRKRLEHSFCVNKVLIFLFTTFDCISIEKLVL